MLTGQQCSTIHPLPSRCHPSLTKKSIACVFVKYNFERKRAHGGRRFLDGSVAALESFINCETESGDRSERDGDTYRTVAADTEVVKIVDRRHVDELSYEDFVLEYMLPNRPVLIKVHSPTYRRC